MNSENTISTNKPKCAFVTAAGLGTRLKPYTDTLPKPLVQVQGRPILDYVLDSLQEYGIERVIMNTHYKAEAINEYADQQSKTRPFEIITLHEDKLLDTGGGIKTGLPYFDDEPFFALSSDSFWSNGELQALERMAQSWNPQHMDLLLMLQPLDNVTGHTVGDYDFVSQNGSIKRSHARTGTHMWTSVRICKPSLFENTHEAEAFSFLHIMDKAEQGNALYGLEHDGKWYHISNADDLEQINSENINEFKAAI